MQEPTIGRKVWYWNYSNNIVVYDDTQACDATIIYVNHSTEVDLLVVDHEGHTHVVKNVELNDPDTAYNQKDTHSVANYCTWMPYQKAQHEKATQAT